MAVGRLNSGVPGKSALTMPNPLGAPITLADVSGVRLGDLNADGFDDLIMLTHYGHQSYVYLNPGSGDFSLATPTAIGSGSHSSSEGGTIVVRDSRGQIRCFMGHVCGEQLVYRSFKNYENLDELYNKCLEDRFKEYEISS